MRVMDPSGARSCHAQSLVDFLQRWMRMSHVSFISATSSSYLACIAADRGGLAACVPGRLTRRLLPVRSPQRIPECLDDFYVADSRGAQVVSESIG